MRKRGKGRQKMPCKVCGKKLSAVCCQKQSPRSYTWFTIPGHKFCERCNKIYKVDITVVQSDLGGD